MHLPTIKACNVQFQHLKIILVKRNLQKLLCVLNVIRRNTGGRRKIKEEDSSEEKEKGEVAGTSDDVELFIH